VVDYSNQYLNELGQSLKADFMLVSANIRKEFIDTYRLNEEKPDFTEFELSQLWSMELFLLKSLPKESLQRRTWIVREKFRLQVGDNVFGIYKASLPDGINDEALRQPLSDDNYLLLKEDVANIARQMQRLNYYKIQRNHQINRKKKIPIWILLGLLVLVVCIFSFGSCLLQNDSLKMILLAAHFGMAGAVVSLVQRIEYASTAPTNFTDTALDSTDISQAISTTYIVSLVFSGAVFSVLVYFLARSELINVFELMPKFDDIKQVAQSADNANCKQANVEADFFTNFIGIPKDSTQTAKLFILCFISGFAERFVPDVLDRLIKTAKSG
jgi:hypothetical protein